MAVAPIVWEPLLLIGDSARERLGQFVSSVLREWSGAWGTSSSVQVTASVVPSDTATGQSVGAPNSVATYKWTCKEKGSAMILVPRGFVSAVLLGSESLPGAKTDETPIASALEVELVTDMAARLLGPHVGTSELVREDDCAIKSIADLTRARWVTLRCVGIGKHVELGVLFSPAAVQYRLSGGSRADSANARPTRRTVAVAAEALAISAEFPPLEISLSDVATLEAGDVILLGADADKELRLIAGQTCFAKGMLGRSDDHRAVSVAELVK